MTPEEFKIKYPSSPELNFDKAARQLVLNIKSEHRDELEGELSDKVMFAIESIWASSIACELGIPPYRSALCVPLKENGGEVFTLQEIAQDARDVTVIIMKRYVAAIKRAKERILG